MYDFFALIYGKILCTHHNLRPHNVSPLPYLRILHNNYLLYCPSLVLLRHLLQSHYYLSHWYSQHALAIATNVWDLDWCTIHLRNVFELPHYLLWKERRKNKNEEIMFVMISMRSCFLYRTTLIQYTRKTFSMNILIIIQLKHVRVTQNHERNQIFKDNACSFLSFIRTSLQLTTNDSWPFIYCNMSNFPYW